MWFLIKDIEKIFSLWGFTDINKFFTQSSSEFNRLFGQICSQKSAFVRGLPIRGPSDFQAVAEAMQELSEQYRIIVAWREIGNAVRERKGNPTEFFKEFIGHVQEIMQAK